MNAVRAFFDTNILLYMYGGDDLFKTVTAKDLFFRHTRLNLATLSTQVVQEFYAVGSCKLRMPRQQLIEAVALLLNLPLVQIDRGLIEAAIETELRYRISFWDALILSAAESAGAEIVFTEHLNHNQRYGSVTVRNPFRDSAVSPA